MSEVLESVSPATQGSITEPPPIASTPATAQTQTARGAPDAPPLLGAGEYLSFKLGDEEYGVHILQVQEIRSYEQATRIAEAPPDVLGVVNLRGVIVPLLDLRRRFGLGEKPVDATTVIIVLNLRGHVSGVVVDSVNDVVQLKAEHLQPAPQFNHVVDSGYIGAIANIPGRMMVLLDMKAVVRDLHPGHARG